MPFRNMTTRALRSVLFVSPAAVCGSRVSLGLAPVRNSPQSITELLSNVVSALLRTTLRSASATSGTSAGGSTAFAMAVIRAPCTSPRLVPNSARIPMTNATGMSTQAAIAMPFFAVAVSFAANGGFDAIDKIFGKTKVINDELIVDSTMDGENAEVYLNVANDPKLYNDGEILTFRVKKVSQK